MARKLPASAILEKDMQRIGQIVMHALAGCMFAILIFSIEAPGKAMAQDRTSMLVSQLIGQIHATTSPIVRMTVSQDLQIVLNYLSDEGKLKNIDDSVVKDLAELLDDDNDVVRGAVAASLGWIGPRAAGAVPALQEALQRVDAEREALPIFPQVDSRLTIEETLEKITGKKMGPSPE